MRRKQEQKQQCKYYRVVASDTVRDHPSVEYVYFARYTETYCTVLNLYKLYFGMDYECPSNRKPLSLLTSGHPVNICAPMVRYSRYVPTNYGHCAYETFLWFPRFRTT